MKAYRFPLILLSSVLIGGIIGLVFGEKATLLKPFGDLFLNAMFTVVVPLVFFTIASSIANMGGTKRLGKIMGSMLGVFLFTGLIAALYMVVVVKIIPPAQGVSLQLEKPEALEDVTLADQIVSTFTVPDFVELFSRNNMLAMIVFSVLVGLSVSMIGEKGKPFASFLASGSEVLMKLVSLIMYYAPIGLGAYFATLVGEYGPMLLGTYFKAGVMYYVSAFLYFVIAFTIYAFMSGKKQAVTVFWKNMLSPTVTSLATCSSAASIPVNLEATRKMGVSADIRETTVPLGAALHKDGSVLGGVLKIAFLFGIFEMNFSGFGTLTSVVLVAILVGTVMGAIPSGGMIGEMLILTLYGFPPEALPIIAAISTIIDPPATMLNATGDNVSSMMVSRLVEGKDWLKKKSAELSSKIA
ncbi:dicarboxylate/amino acid:cation symporter [Peribacillus frigoritolerans]|uniref:dicarboxylate/amino acid:cation symporter n=1 Tax=Peribacillus frigoritolerans TaxID=450367 RepID=UPI00105A2391|nr:dicarboxylate/amino acid:cation symporter [Peribacillus frigoritolerans]TDL78580.1 dicarboxylate/amino acid:cation symporter [Peribacillus frigoritolerans]